MKRILAAVVLTLAATQLHAQTPTEQQCSAAVELALQAMQARRAGATEDAVLAVLRQQGMTGGLAVWAVKQAYRLPDHSSDWIVRGGVFGACEAMRK